MNSKSTIKKATCLIVCCSQIVTSSLGSLYHSSSSPNGPIQTNHGQPIQKDVPSTGKNCSSGYVTVSQSISESQWCTKNCADCEKLENGTYKAPDPTVPNRPKPCDCVAGTKFNERSRVGTKVTMTGGLCIYLDSGFEGSVKGKADLELLKKGIAKVAGLFGGELILDLALLGDLRIGGTVSVPFTYSKTTWSADPLPALNCDL